MPSLPSLHRGPRPDPNAIYVSVEGFAFATPYAPTHVPHGSRRRGSDPIVQATFASGLWVPDGATDDELAEARRARVGLPPAPIPQAKPPVTSGYGETLDEGVPQMKCTKVVTLTVANQPIVVRPGQVVSAVHPAVMARPEHFEKVEETESA